MRSVGCDCAIHGCDEPVSATRQRFHESRILGGVSEGVAELVDGCIEAFIEVHHRVGPDRPAQFLPGYDFAVPFQEQREHPKWLLLQSDLRPVLAELAGAQIDFERPEPDGCSGGLLRDFHALSSSDPSLACARAQPNRCPTGSRRRPGRTRSGNLAGIFDLNDGGAVPSSLPISFGPNGPNPATFTVAPNGRGIVSVSVATSSGTVAYNFVFYARAIGQGFLLEQPASDGSNRGRSGLFLPVDVTSGGNGTFIGSTSVATAASTNALAVLPLVASKNSGSFQNGTGYASVLGSPAGSSSISGTFTVTDATNNRGTVTVTTGSIAGSGTGAFYEVTSTEVIVVGTDPLNLEPQIITFDQLLDSAATCVGATLCIRKSSDRRRKRPRAGLINEINMMRAGSDLRVDRRPTSTAHTPPSRKRGCCSRAADFA